MDKFRRTSTSDVISLFFLVIFLLSCSVPIGKCQLGPPPTLQVDRNWRVPEDEPVGTRVGHAQAKDILDEHRELSFAIQPSEHNDFSGYFRIDPKTGAIFLHQSVKGKRGQQGYLYVSVRAVSKDDDEESPSIPARIEVRIQIDPPIGEASSGPHQGHGNVISRPPSFHPHSIVPPIISYPPPGSLPPLPPPENFPKIPLPTSTSSAPIFNSSNKKNSSSTESQGSKSSVASSNNNKNNTNTFTSKTTPRPSPTSTLRTTTKLTTIINNDEHNGNTLYDLNQNNNSRVPVVAGVKPLNVETDNGSTYLEEGDSNSIGENSIVAKGNVGETGAAKVDNKPQDNSHTVALVTVIPIVVLFGIVPIVLAILWLLKKRSNKVKKRPTKEIRKESAITTASSSVTMSGEGESPSALTHWVGKRAQSNRYESWDPDAVPTQVQNRWEFPRHHLQIGGILGEGCFGQVWRAELIDKKNGTTTVAVKTLKESAGERERADLLSELNVMKMLDPHPNVIKLLGCCTEKDPIFVIMEYVDMGKLQTYLRDSRAHHYYGNLHGDSSSLSSKDLTSFAHQIARGMEFLASKGIIHRDLAARNILIDKDRVCRVADFGFARDVCNGHVYERKSDGRLPIRWMAPEALYDNIFTVKSDCWSFGVLMWEIVTLGSTPYPGMAAGEVMRKVRDGYRLEKPEHCRRELYNIMFYCWAHNPDDRPTFAELVNFLRHLLFSETDYIELERFPDHDYYNLVPQQNDSQELFAFLLDGNHEDPISNSRDRGKSHMSGVSGEKI